MELDEKIAVIESAAATILSVRLDHLEEITGPRTGTSNLAELILIASGEKPAGHFYNLPPSWRDYFTELARSIELYADTSESNTYIGQNPKWVSRLKKAVEENNDLEFGLCEGYPPTSIKAHIK